MFRRSSIAVSILGAVLAAHAQAPVAKVTPPVKQHNAPEAAKESRPPAPPAPAPIPQMSPEQLPPQPPRVIYQGGQLSIDSQNASLADILHEIHTQTNSQIDLPPSMGKERVAAHISGSPREVVNELLEGARVGYIILGSPDDPNAIQKIILSVLPQEASNGQTPAGHNSPWKAGSPNPEAQEEDQAEAAPVEPEPPPPPPQPAQVSPPDQNAPARTPQQMLQNLQKMRDQQNQNTPQQ